MQLRDLLARPLSVEFGKVIEVLNRGGKVSIFGMDASHKAHLAEELNTSVLFVCADLVEQSRIFENIQNLLRLKGESEDSVQILREREDVLSRQATLSKEQTYMRLETLDKLLLGEVKYLIATPESLVNYLPNKDKFVSNTLVLRKGHTLEDSLARQLVNAGYRRTDVVDSKGCFLNRGDVVDIYPIGSQAPVRIELWGDTIETIKYYDPLSMEMLSSVDEIRILPAVDVLYDMPNEVVADKIKGLGYKYLCPDSVSRRKAIESDVLLDLESGVSASKYSWILPFVKEGMSTIYDYLPSDTVIVYDECKALVDKLATLYSEHSKRVSTLAESGELTTQHICAILPMEQVYKREGSLLAYQQITTANNIFNPDYVESFKTTALSRYFSDSRSLIDDLLKWRQNGYTVVLLAPTQDDALSLSKEINKDIFAHLSSIEDIPLDAISVVGANIKDSLVFHKSKTVLIGNSSLSRKKSRAHTRRKRDNFVMPSSGEYVVHDVHGIGLFRGVKRIRTDVEKEYAEIEYRDGDLLYVSVEQMDLVERYSGTDNQPILSKIGGKEFSKIKEKVKASVKDLAINLVELYKEREEKRGFRYSEDSPYQIEFENAFEYEETQDQLVAVEEIKADMQSGRIMDRLLCGDVGYGKTEVALRAIFKAILDGKQCAILAPTTILSQQHYNTAFERLSPYGIEVAVVNRFKKPKEIQNTLVDIATGKVNLVCGTHRLLSKDVVFSDLGLLVLDEEQRFGVEDKEKIKDLKRDVNVLTLSATPIPRTLHMSLSGIRDISVLETPPKGRLAVETHVCELTDSLIVDAVMREYNRGGQCFVLFNKVQGINTFAEKLRNLLPDINIGVAHGQMSNEVLEKRIAEFYNGDSDVLLSTTIIENGIDLPRANTIIVANADKLGLSQLYQLRGRVGRSDRLAHAYFTYEEGKVLTEDAYKRLTALMEYTDLGSGFKIAMRDLEIRGSGNILGKEQSGHMVKVGYDMYLKLLDEAIGELKGEDKKPILLTDTRIDLDVGIPEDYVFSENERIRYYKEIARVSSEDEANDIRERIKALRGAIPDSLENLIVISLMKNLASRIGVKQIVCNRTIAGVIFDSLDSLKNQNVLYAISSMAGKCIIQAGMTPMVRVNTNGSIKDKNLIILQLLLNANRVF